MASSINASTSGAGGVITTADNTGILNIQTAGTTAVTVDASQRVGIGGTTVTDGHLLNIQGSSATNNIGVVLNKTNATAQIWGITNSGPLTFYDYTSSAERMRIDSSGNVIVNNTAQLGIGKFGVLFAGSTNNGIEIQDSTTTSGAVFSGFRNSAGTLIGSISRNTTTNAVLYNTSSDYRLKENITPLTNALDKISALKPCKWTWKDCDGIEGEGFIAHEVQEIIPAAVSGEKDAVDAEGNIKAQGMDASYLVATLTAAIQEQQTIINDLKARVTALENK